MAGRPTEGALVRSGPQDGQNDGIQWWTNNSEALREELQLLPTIAYYFGHREGPDLPNNMSLA